MHWNLREARKKHWGSDQGELSPPPTFFYSSLRAKLVEVWTKMWLEVTGTGSDCSRVEYSAGTLAMYLGSDIKRHLKQAGSWDSREGARVKAFPNRCHWILIPQQKKIPHCNMSAVWLFLDCFSVCFCRWQ